MKFKSSDKNITVRKIRKGSDNQMNATGTTASKFHHIISVHVHVVNLHP